MVKLTGCALLPTLLTRTLPKLQPENKLPHGAILCDDREVLWQIRDFKGIGSAELDIRPGKATVLTGVNSSGKSSIIQSLLLIAQSLQNDNQVVLNGPLIRLGDAQDLVREGAERNAIELSIGLENGSDDDEVDGRGVHAVFDLVAAEDRSSLRTRHVTIVDSSIEGISFEMGRENSRASDANVALEATAHLGSRDALHLKSLLDSGRRQLRTYVAMNGLRPVAIVQFLNPEEIAKRYRTLLGSLLHERESGATHTGSVATARISGSNFIREFVRLFSQDPSQNVSRKEFSEARTGNPFAFDRAWQELSEEKRQSLIDSAASSRMERPFVVLPIRRYSRGLMSTAGILESQFVDTMGATYEALSILSNTLDKFSDRVQYLGPLRDEPRVVWNHWNELARGLPVGTRGEYSAAVLSRSSATRIEYTPPPSPGGQPSVTVAPLSEAVNRWLTYLQIGDSVSARSHGKLGVGLDLQMGGRIRDLTSVGVGVSQALPLLVGLLTSPRESIFIVEQPELHLHPAVQARLADFMLNARPDLAVVIETHSESFVTRIRRRAAEGSLDVRGVDITFVEPSTNGSVARVLSMSEFGDLSDWPQGFLSVAEEDVQAILRANIDRMNGGNGAS